VMEAAASGDAAAMTVVRLYAQHLASGLVNLTMVLDPACIVLGGGAMTRHEVLMPLVLERFERLLGGSAGLRPIPELRAAQFGPQSGAVGAALLALRAVDAFEEVGEP